jgi:MMP 1-O-methyltransferase
MTGQVTGGIAVAQGALMPEALRAAAVAARGWLPDDQGLLLYQAAREQAAHGPLLEVGSYCGKSAVYLGAGAAAAGGLLLAVDHHRGSSEHQPGGYTYDERLFDPQTGGIDTLPAFRALIAEAGLEDHVCAVVGESARTASWWSTPLAMVFLDGSHHVHDAMADYAGWSRWVLPGGLLAIHDVYPAPRALWQEGPYQVYCRALAEGFVEHRDAGTLRILRRPADA